MKKKKKPPTNGKDRMKQLKRKQQVAALPFKFDDNGEAQILIITSRGTGRWIIPKGWTMVDKAPWQAAAQEAMEEAGVSGRISKNSIGTFRYDKWISRNKTIPCRVSVFPLEVSEEYPRWQEKNQRERRWVSPEKAARSVTEKDLKSILNRFARKAAA